jgi:DNA invertase Pin-like site-specific DNA recombinase
MNKIRCAIYTRKSSEEGLDQEFNSLDAQREACASYIASQKHEGWVMLPNHYDDGGISGGTLERPSLQRLMRDVDEGQVDQIVVYKIDRLTRSLADFAKLVDRLDAKKASFVSVTQSFNTATSMGRLTLNVLLSFAQFEREVTAERIRDKISASKKKGLWMGGNVPLGYDPDGRTLVINEPEAETVRTLFDLYGAQNSIVEVKAEADRLRLKGKHKFSSSSEPTVSSLSRGQIYYILSNPIYAGLIRHKDKVYDGQHPAIIEPTRWDRVQIQLQSKSSRKRGRSNRPESKSSLTGKLFDETGDRLTPSYANKQGRRYRYYISSRLVFRAKGNAQKPSNEICPQTPSGWRLPAAVLEKQLSNSVCDHLNRSISNGTLGTADAEQIGRLDRHLKELQSDGSSASQIQLLDCINSATLKPGEIAIELDPNRIISLLGVEISAQTEQATKFTALFQFRKRGVETKLIIGMDTTKNLDEVLIRNIAKAHQYYASIKSGQTFDQLAASDGLSKRRLLQIIPFAYVAPDIVKSIIAGLQPISLTSEWLQRHPLPNDWDEQRGIVAKL